MTSLVFARATEDTMTTLRVHRLTATTATEPGMPNVPAGKVAAHLVALAANVADSVDFTDRIRAVDIITNGAADVYYTTDGTTPTVGGTNTYRIPVGTTGITNRRLDVIPTAATIKLIAPAAVIVSVQKA